MSSDLMDLILVIYSWSANDSGDNPRYKFVVAICVSARKGLGFETAGVVQTTINDDGTEGLSYIVGDIHHAVIMGGGTSHVLFVVAVRLILKLQYCMQF